MSLLAAHPLDGIEGSMLMPVPESVKWKHFNMDHGATRSTTRSRNEPRHYKARNADVALIFGVLNGLIDG